MTRVPRIGTILAAALFAAPAGADDCAAIPPGDHRGGLIFNPPGRQTFFLRSQCYMDQALATLDPAPCAEVRERRSLFFDGSYYSEETCREIVGYRRALADAPKLPPEAAYRLTGAEVAVIGTDRANVTVTLSADGAPGRYTLDIWADYVSDGTEVRAALNPVAPPIRRTTRPEPMTPVEVWAVDLGRDTAALTFAVDGALLREALRIRRAGKPVTLTLRLDLMQTDGPARPDPAQRYVSALNLDLPATGTVRVER